MNPAPDERGERLIEAFNEAKALPAGEQRDQFVDKACGTDEHFRAELHSLLRAGNSAGDYLRGGPAVSPQLESEFARLKPEEAGERIGQYKLLEEIGQGGFGTVWMAAQEEPVRRRVALKIIKLGMDTREVIARFEQERQALAMMDHPNIATVLDGGATHLGRPYFVMELVKGVPITEFCDQRQFTPRERLELFAQVCHAVQHAHQKGIIHRDIKPSNVMVSMHDTTPVVKVIDFGIAKALGHELTGRTMFTGFAQLIGTPLYMSPEQAGESAIDVDTRSDIYSLGVLLYELLTGTTPFNKERFRQAAQDEIRRIVCEEEPPKPSTRLSESKDSLASISALRHMEPAKLTKLVRGDLDWIVMKCLEKDRARRYETANGLAADIRRHLESEPVVARPPSTAYRLQKTFRRNKLVFTAAMAVAAALVVGIAISSWHAFQATKARNSAQAAQAQAQAEQRKAEAERSRAESEQQRAEKLAEQNRRNLYAARIKLAEQIASEGNPGRVIELLNSLRPGPGETDLRSFDWHYLYQLSGSERLTFAQSGRLRTVAFSPDGRLVATAGDAKVIYLVDTGSGSESAQLKGHEGAIAAIGFLPDGKTLVSAAADGTVRMWDVQTHRQVDTLFQGTNALGVMAVSPDGKLLAIGEGQLLTDIGQANRMGTPGKQTNRVFILNLETRRLQCRSEAYRPMVALSFAPDNQRLALAEELGQVHLLDVTTGSCVAKEPTNSNGRAAGLAFSPDGKHLLVPNWNMYDEQGRIRMLDAATLEEVETLVGQAGRIFSLARSADGTTLLTGTVDGAARLWNRSTGEAISAFYGQRQVFNQCMAVAFAPDGRTIATAGWDGSMKLWDTQSSPVKQRIPTRASFSVAFSPDGSLLACASKAIEIRDAATGHLLRTLTNYVSGDMRIAFSPDGTLLAATGIDTEVHCWDTRTWDHWTPQPDPKSIGSYAPDTRLAFSPDSRLLAVGGVDGTLRCWEVKSGTSALQFSSLPEQATSVAFTLDGRHLFTGHSHVDEWDLATQKVTRSVRNSGGIVRITRDGRTLASLRGSKIVLFDLPELKERAVLTGHRDTIYCIAFSHDSRLVATTSWDGTVKLWQASSGEELLTIKSGRRTVWSVAFAPDDRTLAFGCGSALDGEVIVLRTDFTPIKVGTGDALAMTSELARCYLQAGRVADAIQLLADASTRKPASTHLTLKLAALQVWLAKDADHAATCRRMLEWAANTSDYLAAERVAKVTCLRPIDDAPMREATLNLARRAVELGQRDKSFLTWAHMVLGMAEYRSGHYPAADEALATAAKMSGGGVVHDTASFYRAMSLSKQGKQAEARELFTATEAKMKPLPGDEKNPLADGQSNSDHLIAWLAFKEAKALLQPQVQPAPAKSEGTTPP